MSAFAGRVRLGVVGMLLLALAGGGGCGGARGADGLGGAGAWRGEDLVEPASPPYASGAARVFARVRAGVDLDGAPVAAHLVAGKPAIFVVFASWCVHCRHELGILADLRATDPEVQIVGLNAYEDWEDASNEATLRAYLEMNAPWLTVVRSDDAMLNELGGVPKIPSLFVFDGEGQLARGWKRNEGAPPTLAQLQGELATLRQP
jgi:thiol-disulfide isomerase/thioredoxin